MKVVKNKIAPPFKKWNLTSSMDENFQEGDILDLAVDGGLVDKAGPGIPIMENVWDRAVRTLKVSGAL